MNQAGLLEAYRKPLRQAGLNETAEYKDLAADDFDMKIARLDNLLKKVK